MDISFETKLIRRICTNRNSAIRNLGDKHAYYLHDRLADIEASENGSELKLLAGLFVLNDDTGKITSALNSNIVLEAIAGPNKVLRDSFGRIDWQEVIRLKVISVRGSQ